MSLSCAFGKELPNNWNSRQWEVSLNYQRDKEENQYDVLNIFQNALQWRQITNRQKC